MCENPVSMAIMLFEQWTLKKSKHFNTTDAIYEKFSGVLKKIFENVDITWRKILKKKKIDKLQDFEFHITTDDGAFGK